MSESTKKQNRQMTNSASHRIRSFFSSSRNIYLIGLVLGMAATAIELARGRAENLVTFRDATQLFWQGISAYTDEFTDQHHRFFIYSPVFNMLFTPFAFLPRWISGILWNLCNYTLLFLAIRNLPGYLKDKSTQIALYLILIIVESLFCFQYNVVVCYIFLWAFILLEKDRPFWAVLLIMLSATTKIYGIVQLGLLFCYPKVWRNMGYAVLCGIGLLLLPVLKTGIDGLIPCYMDWFNALSSHHDTTGTYPSLIFAIPGVLPHMRIFQASVMLVLIAGFFALKSRWSDLRFRTQALGILMGYIILFSEASEPHTYVIALSGYMLCWHTWPKHTLFDKIMFWAVLVMSSVVPTDLLCPSDVHRLLNNRLFFNVWCYTIVWITMIYKTINNKEDSL